MLPVRVLRLVSVLCFALAAVPAYAQQTGAIIGKVVDTSGGVLPGVTVEARADVLPTPRVTTTGADGEFRLPALPPGTYTLKFDLTGMQPVTRQALVQLGADTVADATLGIGVLTEAVTVTAATTMIERDSATIQSGVSSEQITALPVAQEYRDLLKLIPAVQFTQDAIRGPSAGGSGQDNVYQFDGVNVTLPLFGTLASEPASHDIEQVTTIRGGARAIDFDRSGGFFIDTVSKSGTNRYAGMVQYQFQNARMAANLVSGSASRYEQDRTWVTANIGGPVLEDKLFFFASYYRPNRQRELRSNNYGDLPDYENSRNEAFGKLTYTPVSNILINGTYRDLKREETSDLFGESSAPTTGTGSEARQRIATGEASWVINSRSHLSGRFTRFELMTLGRPDFVAEAEVNPTIGTQIDLNALDRIGRFTVPTITAATASQSAFLQPLIDRYGYVGASGARVGGGIVGFGSQFDDIDFYRTEGKVGYNITFGSNLRHDLHAGYQWYTDQENLLRTSNGWGLISAPAGTVTTNGTPVFIRAVYQQQGTGVAPVIRSYYRSQSLEFNDTIHWNNFTFNLGVLASNDTMYGQGLREDSSKPLTGFVSAPGVKYEMLNMPLSKMIQPRIGTTWAFNGRDTVYASFARYHPAASSLPRAASWDRNLANTQNADFDATGRLFAVQAVRSSSGKLFVEGLDPRQVDELLVGTAFQLSPKWSMRVYGRHRKGSNFWEDVNNNARSFPGAPADVAARGLYIPDLTQRIAEIGSGSTYVIAELDGAYTKYDEATVESEWRGARAFVRGSYTWSKYYGNFDQDNTTTVNDQNIFIGSSFIGDGIGRQLWNFRDGRLRGDRPHMLKVYGYHTLPWHALVGGFLIAQSGQPWEAWDRLAYPGGDTSDSGKYVEPAGSRRSASHYQVDMKYTQDVRLTSKFTVQLIGDFYNIFNDQTGYNNNPVRTSPTFGNPRNYFDPRLFQLTVRLKF